VRFCQIIAIVWLVLACALAPAHPEKRVALVIGNDRYANLPANEQLQKAVNDARAVGKALEQLRFDVISGENLGKQALLNRLDAAAQRLTPGDTVFFFFSGHGVAVNGVNYILPADVPVVGTGQVASLTGAAIKEEDITDRFLGAGARVAVVVLDACRNNPFGSSGTRGIGGERGLAPHEPPSGVFTFYSAGRGQAALDRLSDGERNPNSVFTRVLLPALVRTDLDLAGLAIEVRDEVTRLARSVSHDQRPAYYDETSGGRIFLAGAGNGRAGGGAPPDSAGCAGRPAAGGRRRAASRADRACRPVRWAGDGFFQGAMRRAADGRAGARAEAEGWLPRVRQLPRDGGGAGRRVHDGIAGGGEGPRQQRRSAARRDDPQAVFGGQAARHRRSVCRVRPRDRIWRDFDVLHPRRQLDPATGSVLA
jgi:hypothetical protein